MQCTQNEDQTREGGVRRDRLEPFVVQVEEHHLRSGRSKNHVTKLLDLHSSLEGELQFRGTDGDVGEIKQMHLERVEQTLTGHDKLLRLFFHRQRSDESRHFFSSLPLRQLTKTLLTSPDTRVDNLQEQLSSARVEDEDGTVDRLGRQVTFEGLVDCYTIDVGVIDKQLDLVAEQFRVVLRVEELLRTL